MIKLTPLAYNKVCEMLEKLNTPKFKLRLTASRVGSIIQYEIGFDDHQAETDIEINEGELPVLVDLISKQYITSLLIDYKSDQSSAGFIIKSQNVNITDKNFHGDK